MLTASAEALARGDFQHKVQLPGNNELAVLGNAFNYAAQQLQKLYDDLRQSERELRDVIEAMPTMVWIAGTDGLNEFGNRRWQEYSGLSLDRTVGSGWQDTVHPADLERHREKWCTSLASGEPFENEVRYRRAADGQYRWFLSRALPLHDEHGKILKWYGVSTDIDDRKCAEQEREQLRANLAHVNRVSMLGELAASIAHEIKQPISAASINASTCLLWLGREQPDIEKAREAVSGIIQNVTRASDIMSKIRVLFKKGEQQRERVDVNEAIGEIISLLRSEAGRYTISIHTELAPELPHVMADRVQLQQVFMNLMRNAIDAIHEADIAGDLIIKSQWNAVDQLLISISDTGIGLLPDQADKVFDAFFTTKPQGTGMGLSISRSIIESHGGRLWRAVFPGVAQLFSSVYRRPPPQQQHEPAKHSFAVVA